MWLKYSEQFARSLKSLAANMESQIELGECVNDSLCEARVVPVDTWVRVITTGVEIVKMGNKYSLWWDGLTKKNLVRPDILILRDSMYGMRFSEMRVSFGENLGTWSDFELPGILIVPLWECAVVAAS